MNACVCEVCYIIFASASPCRVDELHQQLDDLWLCSSQLHLVIRGLHHTGCTCKTSGSLLQLETSNATSTTAHTIITVITLTCEHEVEEVARGGQHHSVRQNVFPVHNQDHITEDSLSTGQRSRSALETIHAQACIDIALHF